MNINEVQQTLQKIKNSKIPQSEIAKALKKDRSNINAKAKRGTELKLIEVEMLEKYFNVVLTDSVLKTAKIINNINTTKTQHAEIENFSDRIEITYWQNFPDNLKNNCVSSLWFDREIIENIWNVKSDSLVIITMLGDNLSSYKNNDYPIKNKDILIVDCSQTNIMVRGVYFATSRQNSRFWVREMELKLDDSIDFYSYTPNGETVKSYSKEELNNADFRIIGKVIKNISFKM